MGHEESRGNRKRGERKSYKNKWRKDHETNPNSVSETTNGEEKARMRRTIMEMEGFGIV